MKQRAIIEQLRLPAAPTSITKGASLKELLGEQAVDCLAWNVSLVYPAWDAKAFRQTALDGLEPLTLMERGPHLAQALRQHLPPRFDQAIKVMLASLPAPLEHTEGNGLAVFFFHPHTSFVAAFGRYKTHNGGRDPFDAAMTALYELTQRFTAEFSIRPFLIDQQERTLARLSDWLTDPSPHVRRLCSEGTRPRLPWGQRLSAFVADPGPALPILEALKDDPALYVRRSVANHLGDIAKDHLELVLDMVARWLQDSSAERRWLIRHALRHPAKQGHREALRLRAAAK